MSDSTDDESSDSSNEFLISPDKINLDSSFFTENFAQPNLLAKVNIEENNSSSDDDDDDDDFKNVTCTESAELFSRVLKNLEDTKLKEHNDDRVTNNASTFETSTTEKKKEETQIKSDKKNILSNEISELLLQGESGTSSLFKDDDTINDKNIDKDTVPYEYTIPKEGVKITLPGTNFILNNKKRSNRNTDTFVKTVMNRLRANQILIHKVGLLCWLAHGFHLNRVINKPEVLSAVQALVSQSNYPKARLDLTYLKKFTKWFKTLFVTEMKTNEEIINEQSLIRKLNEKKVLNYKELVLLYAATLRSIGLNCRLILSLYPPDLKIQKSQCFQPDSKIEKRKQTSTLSKVKKDNKNISNDKVNSKASATNKSESKIIAQNSPVAKRNANLNARKRAAAILQATPSSSQNNNDTTDIIPRNNHHKKVQIKTDRQDITERTQTESSSMSRKLRNRVISNVAETKPKVIETNLSPKYSMKKTKRETRITKIATDETSGNSEEEFLPKQKACINVKSQLPVKSKRATKKEVTNKSSDYENKSDKKITQDMWVEVYVESEQNWICVNIMSEEINCANEIYKKAKNPVLYIIAWNSEGSLKDVTRRYSPYWLTVTRKKRVDEKWWSETLSIWKEKETTISRAEDNLLLQKELEQPLPKTVGEYKGHPLYVLTRHLLKYEALYPPDCVPLGHLRTGEAVYSRYCVHTLCSRETWIKKARVVKPAQEPYKIVKALPKYDKLSGMKLKDSALELFGKWQTTEYIPPEAKDGIVPRNEYGNVDLFKQCMLPKGTVHIDLPGLNRIARKLNIDCAPAVVGFKFGCMGAVPAFEGFVVCSEYEDALREAWEAEQIEAAKRAKEKREKRIYGNWKKLIRGLLVREKLAAKYEFEDQTFMSSNKRTKQKKTDKKKIKTS